MVNDYVIIEDKVCIYVPHTKRATGITTVYRCWISHVDFERVSKIQKRITYLPNGYGYARFQTDVVDETTGKKKSKTILLHRFLLDVPEGMTVDHNDWDGLNNVRDNIKIVTYQENLSHRRKFKVKKASPYKGVYPYCNGQWISKITIDGKNKILGYFDNQKSAARAYDQAALEAFGEAVVLNFPIKH